MVKLLVIEGYGIRKRYKKIRSTDGVKTMIFNKIERIPLCRFREEAYRYITK